MYLSILGFANHIVHITSQCIIKAVLLRKSVLQTCQWLHMYIACLFCVDLSFVTGPFSHNIIRVGKSFVVSHKTLHLMNCILKKPECAPREQEASLNTQVLANHSSCRSIQSCISRLPTHKCFIDLWMHVSINPVWVSPLMGILIIHWMWHYDWNSWQIIFSWWSHIYTLFELLFLVWKSYCSQKRPPWWLPSNSG